MNAGFDALLSINANEATRSSDHFLEFTTRVECDEPSCAATDTRVVAVQHADKVNGSKRSWICDDHATTGCFYKRAKYTHASSGLDMNIVSCDLSKAKAMDDVAKPTLDEEQHRVRRAEIAALLGQATALTASSTGNDNQSMEMIHNNSMSTLSCRTRPRSHRRHSFAIHHPTKVASIAPVYNAKDRDLFALDITTHTRTNKFLSSSSSVGYNNHDMLPPKPREKPSIVPKC